MHLHFQIFLLVYHIFIFLSGSNAERNVKENDEARLAEFLSKISDVEFNQALSRLTFNDLFTLNSFMDASKNIVAEDDYENENYQDEHKQRRLHNNHLEDTESDLNDNKQNFALDESNIKYKRAVLAAELSWANKRRTRDASIQQKAVEQQQQLEQQVQQQEQPQQLEAQSKISTLRRKRENAETQDKLIHEQYLRDLENSFPRDLEQRGDDALVDVKEHVRIKRK